MNKFEKIRELKEEISNEMKEPWGCGRSPFEILTDILSLMEDDVKDVDAKGVVEEHCCGNGGQKITAEEFPCCCEFETCDKPCTVRANYFKENSRVELNKLALSILKESLKDKKYRESWEFKIEAALYEAVLKHSGDLIKSENMYFLYGKGLSKIFMDRLFGEIE